MTYINLDQLRYLAIKFPEIKKLCTRKVPVYLLQMELERHNCNLIKECYKDLDKMRMQLK